MNVLTIGKGVAVLRSELRLSQAKAALRVSSAEQKIHRQMWSRYEGGIEIPSVKSLFRIIYGLGATLADLEQVGELVERGMDVEQVIEFRRQYAATSQPDESVYDSVIRPMLTTHMRRIRELETENGELREQLAATATRS